MLVPCAREGVPHCWCLRFWLQIVRLEGTNVDAGKKILKTSGIDIIAADDLDDAATKAVASIKA
jgi:succinyl-CoA synthetase beta subunit